MIRLLMLIGFAVVCLANTSHAQIGNIFGNPTPTTARSAWEQLPRQQLACIDQALQEQRSSVTALIQQNVFPNSVRRVIDKCEQDLRPQIVDASQTVKDPSWAARPPEQRLAYFLENFWVDRRRTYFKCSQLDMRAYAKQKTCLASNGFTFEVTSPQKCQLAVVERVPMSDQPTKSWDGKVTSVDIVARDLTFQLSGLDEDLIQNNSGSFDLYFEMTDPTSVVGRIARSDDPTKWIPLPSPSLASAFSASGTDDERYQNFMRSRMAWVTEMGRYGLVDIPGFQIAAYSSQQDTNSESGLKRLRDNRMRTFLKISTAHFSHAYFNDQAVSTMTNAFVETVKAIISRCKR